MAGSLKIACALGEQRYAYTTAPFGTLNGATAWSVSFFFQLETWDTASFGNIVTMGSANPIAIYLTSLFNILGTNSGNTNTISKGVTPDANGHHVLISGNSAGTSTIYLDGTSVATTAALGALLASDTALQPAIGWNDSSHPITFYFRDLALWGSYSASAADATALATGVSTPATLATPATNYWTLQGPAGAVTAGTQGLADALGAVNLDAIFGSGAITYSTHVITSTPIVPPALIMPPFCDTTGNLIIIPLYLNPANTVGGPALPTGIVTPPVFKLNGSTISPTLVPLDGELYAIVYQMPSGTSAISTDTLTMAASPGWASVAAGTVGGTSASGAGGAAVTVVNNAGLAVEAQYATSSRAMKVASNPAPFGMGTGFPGQPAANYARRLPADGWSGTVLTYNGTTHLPLTISGDVYTYFFFLNGTGIDANGTPTTAGLWTLTYGDNSIGANSITHVLDLSLAVIGGWTAVETVVDVGTWDGAAWRGIKKTYLLTYTGSGNVNAGLQITIHSSNGNVGFPSKGNGQVELGIFPPSPSNRSVSSPTTYDPLAIDPEYLIKHQNTYCQRWMADCAGFNAFGDSSMIFVADLAQRAVADFLWTRQTVTVSHVTKVEAIPSSSNVIIDYEGATQSFSNNNWHAGTVLSRCLMLCTTDVAHGLRSGDYTVIAGTTAAPSPAVAQTGNLLTSTISTTSGSTTFSVTDSTGMGVVQIDSEQMTVTSINSLTSVTVTRGSNGTTGATHASGATIYPCVLVNQALTPVWVTSTTQFVMEVLNFSIPQTGTADQTNPTILATVNYTSPNWPIVTTYRPATSGSVPYEMAATISNAIAILRGAETILWINVGMMATDALVTEIVANRIIPYIGSNIKLIVELSNEIFNNGFIAYYIANEIFTTAPNPETSGTGFPDSEGYAASRQNHINLLAKAAFTAASLDPARVYHFQPGRKQNNFAQANNFAKISYCQAHSIPIDLFAPDAYIDMTSDVWALWLSWLPTADGGSAAWTRAIARQVCMSYFRAMAWFSPLLGIGLLGTAQYLSWYESGKSVANSGVGSATANTGLGKMSPYEGGTIIGTAPSSFIHPQAWIFDLTNDPHWYDTETAYFAAIQGAPAMYAALMPAASFPNLPSAYPAFTCYYASIYLISLGEFYFQYVWQGQQPGRGLSNTYSVPSGTAWAGATPVDHSIINESVKAQAAFDWNNAVGGSAPFTAIIMGC